MYEIFTLRQYNLTNWTYFDVPKVRTVNHGSESVRYLGPKIWEIISTHIKELDTTGKFEMVIKKWKPEPSPYKIVDGDFLRLQLMAFSYVAAAAKTSSDL